MREARLLAEEKEYQQMLNQDVKEGPQDWRHLRRALTRIANALLSIFGAAIAIYLISRRSVGWSLEWVSRP